jgi:DNA-binding transcriptional LysR family regulator
MLSVQRLRVLREVARRGSFSAAADALAYTQSAISQAVATLEAETGATLLVRDRRGVRPTAAGEVLVAHADRIVAGLDAAESDLAAVLGLHGGRLRMASFPTAGATLMPRAIAAFRAAHPAVQLSLAEGEPDVIAPRVRDGQLDLALLFELPGFDDALGAELERTPLLEDELYVVLPNGHPLAGEPQLRLEQLRDDAWVQTSATSPYARHVVRLCNAAGFEPSVSFESDDFATVQGLVAAGVGVALVPRLGLAGGRDGTVARALSPPRPARRVVVATERGAAIAPAAATMVGILVDVARAEHADADSPAPR